MSTETPEERIARLAARSAARRQATADPASLPTYGAPAEHKTSAPKPAGRRHAARGSRRAALALSAGTTLSLATYFQIASDHASADQTTTATEAVATPGTPTSVDATPATTVTSTTTAAASKSTATTATTAVTATTAKAATATTTTTLTDGTYTGGTYTNRWGPVQVQITVAGGRITAVTALQVPNSNSKDVSINNRAVPILVQSTLTAQSANISSVSGATYTSGSYKQSLQSAIDAARAAAAK
ncbi:MAG: FMN-binding protein [Acidimicrobiia bacterium]